MEKRPLPQRAPTPYVEHWSDNQKEIDYSKILNSMTFVQQQLILEAARQIPWDKVRNTTRKNVIAESNRET